MSTPSPENLNPLATDGDEVSAFERAQAAEKLVQDLERERQEQLRKINRTFRNKITKALRGAIPPAERRKQALELLDRCREALCVAQGEAAMDDKSANAIIISFIEDGLRARYGSAPAQLEEALSVLHAVPQKGSETSEDAGDASAESGLATGAPEGGDGAGEGTPSPTAPTLATQDLSSVAHLLGDAAAAEFGLTDPQVGQTDTSSVE